MGMLSGFPQMWAAAQAGQSYPGLGMGASGLSLTPQQAHELYGGASNGGSEGATSGGGSDQMAPMYL